MRCRKQALGQLKPLGTAGLRQRAEEFLAFYRRNLIRHFRAEEEVLFPLLRSSAPPSVALIDELMRQHDQIRETIPQIEAAADLAKVIFDLGDLLEVHIRKEERELFPLFEQYVEPAQAETIGEQLKKIAEGGEER